MSSTTIVSLLGALALAASALVGCAAESTAPESSPDAEASPGTASQGLAAGRGLGASYPCEGLVCTCVGDEQCNDMFSSGVCGDISSCDTSSPTPVCTCIKGLGMTRPTRVVRQAFGRVASSVLAPP